MPKRAFSAVLALLFLLLSGCTVRVKQSENQPDTSDYLQIVTLTIAGVGLHLPDDDLSDENMLRAFEKSSGIRVIVNRSGHLSDEAEYLDYLSLLERSASLPDLLIFPSLPEINEKNLLLDLEKYIAADAEYQQIPLPLREAVSYSVGVSAVPLRYYPEGYFVNTAAFSEQKIAAPAFSSGFTRFFSSIQALAESSTALLPLGQFYDIPLWYPAIQEELPTLWGAYDGERFSLNNSHFKNGVSFAAQLREACFPNTAPEDFSQQSAASLRKQWQDGGLALYYGSTRDTADIAGLSSAVAFAGIPGGRLLIDADYIGITADCAHKQEAFALLKWLSYGKEGLQERYADETAARSVSPPLNADPRLSRAFLDANPYDGMQEALQAVDTAIVKGSDYIPSYHTYTERLTYSVPALSDRAQPLNEWIADAVNGSYSYFQYGQKLDELVNWSASE